jgi:hypothetical protein
MTAPNRLTLDISGATLPADTYMLTIAGDGSDVVANCAGDELDGEWLGSPPSGDTTPGGDFEVTFILQ